MSGWLPPGCTDRDIDNAASDYERDCNMPFSGSSEPCDLVECDCCGALLPEHELSFISFYGNTNAPCDTVICQKCQGVDDD